MSAHFGDEIHAQGAEEGEPGVVTPLRRVLLVVVDWVVLGGGGEDQDQGLIQTQTSRYRTGLVGS